MEEINGTWPDMAEARAEGEEGSSMVIGGVNYYSDLFRYMSRMPKAPALMSMMASVFIIQNICKSPAKRYKMTNQIMIGLSLADVGYAATLFLGTWPAPRGQVYGSMGNIATCSAQGFFNLFFFQMGAFFNAALALTFVLMVRFHWTEDSFNNRSLFGGGNTLCSSNNNNNNNNCINYYCRTRWFLLLLPPLFAMAATFPALSQEGFNYTGKFICSGGPYPPGCGTEDLPCQRGDNMTDMFRRTDCFIMCFWITLVQGSVIIGCMLCLVCTVLESERAIDKYQFGSGGIGRHHDASSSGGGGGRSDSAMSIHARADNEQVGEEEGSNHHHHDYSSSDRSGDHSSSMFRERMSSVRALRPGTTSREIRRSRKRTKKVAVQGILYVWAFIITSLGFLLLDVPKKHFSDQFDMINAFVCPLQGLLNVLVFLRPRYLDYRRKHPEFSINPVWYCYRLILRLRLRSKIMLARRFQKRNSNIIEPNDDSQDISYSSSNNNEAAPDQEDQEDRGLLDMDEDYEASSVFLLGDNEEEQDDNCLVETVDAVDDSMDSSAEEVEMAA